MRKKHRCSNSIAMQSPSIVFKPIGSMSNNLKKIHALNFTRREETRTFFSLDSLLFIVVSSTKFMHNLKS